VGPRWPFLLPPRTPAGDLQVKGLIPSPSWWSHPYRDHFLHATGVPTGRPVCGPSPARLVRGLA